jgi:arginine deiminase
MIVSSFSGSVRSDSEAGPWGIDSEYGLLRDVLLCAPPYYNWAPINAVVRQAMTERGPDLAAAECQHREMVAAFGECDVNVHLLEPQPHLIFQSDTRDSSQTTPWGVGILQLRHLNRRGEYAPVLDFYQRNNIPIAMLSSAGTIEGGDISVVKPGLIIVGYSGERTTLEGAHEFTALFRAHGWRVFLQPFPEHFLHLDVLFCIAAENLALVCTDVVPDSFLRLLAEEGIRVIPVTYEEAMDLGCNVISLGNDRVMTSSHNTSVIAKMRAEGLKVVDPDLREFAKGGSGAHCLTMSLRRDRLCQP